MAARILIVEDDDAIRGHLLRVLPAAGYDVDGVPCGEDALDLFRAALTAGCRFGVVILDLGLPDRDGLEVCRDLVALDPTARVVNALMATVIGLFTPIDQRSLGRLRIGMADYPKIACG